MSEFWSGFVYGIVALYAATMPLAVIVGYLIRRRRDNPDNGDPDSEHMGG